MTDPFAPLLAVRNSTAALLAGLEAQRWSDDDLRAPSLLPGWTRAHVLSHLIRNADATAATLSGALRGEIVDRYPGGPQARAAAIDEGAHASALELIVEVRESADRLERVMSAVHEAGVWDAPSSEGRPAGDWPARRWREVEVHRVDLAGDYTPDRWPADFVAALLPELADGLDERTPDGAVHLTVTADGSLVPDLVGREWRASDGGPAVTGPDWALAAWLAGRGAVAEHALRTDDGALPELRPWR